MKRPVFIIAILSFTIFVLSIARVALVNSISTTGADLVKIQGELEKYEKDNAILEEEYLLASSLTTLESQAEQRGFVESKSQKYLSAPLPLARR